jgi:excinuclease ABC subunit C
VNERLHELRKKLATVPETPGVYIHRDSRQKVLYVGKAVNLQARLRSYFFGLERHSIKTRALVSKVFDFEFILTGNEHESLVLENNLIKHHRPAYNILLRDDKTYPYLRFDLREPWPRLIQTRRRRNDGATYFGPYTAVGQMRTVVSLIERFFPLVRCSPTVFRTAKRPCTYYHLKRCPGPCTLPVDRSDYMLNVQSAIDILNGKRGELVERLTAEMAVAAEAMRFEKAALLRDQIRALQGFRDQHQSVSLGAVVDIDVIGSHWQKDAVCFFVAKMRGGTLIGGNHFVLSAPVDDYESLDGTTLAPPEIEAKLRGNLLESFLCQYYLRESPPPVLLVEPVRSLFARKRCELVERFLEKINDARVSLVTTPSDAAKLMGVSVGERRAVTRQLAALERTSGANATERFHDAMRADEQTREGLASLQALLHLSELPVWIECFDISNFQGSETVASQVVFRNGRASRGDYRLYRIKEVEGQDDFRSLREVVRRRFKEERRHSVPDILLIDGGEPQIREVGYLLQSIGLDTINLVGIAKARTERDFSASHIQVSQERLVVPVRRDGKIAPELEPEVVVLRPGTAEFRLVTGARDEAHRFAITLHRKRRDRVKRMSLLHRIDGLGPKRRRQLLEAFQNIDLIKAATAAEIHQKSGLPLSLAEKVLAALCSLDVEKGGGDDSGAGMA